MKVLIFGQATGGNALAWFDYFNRNIKKLDIIFLARTICTLKHDFKVFSPYGIKNKKGFLGKVRNKLASLILIDFYLYYIALTNKVELVVLQGNFTPETNLKVIKRIKSKSIINIYGSDFYRKYLKQEFSERQKKQFLKVLENVDSIMCNWKSTYDDFIQHFPHLKEKTHFVPWGVNPDWSKPVPLKLPMEGKKFISTRALHSNNNIDLVVDAFCQAYPSPSMNTLHIVGAYGNDQKVEHKIKILIDKYNMGDRVTLELDKWYEGNDLIELYDSADYNLCFGNTDQLTISIVYAFTRNVVNILSPISNYRYLKEIDYQTPIITDDISVNSLAKTLRDLDLEPDMPDCSLENDRNKAVAMFDMDATFKSYINLAKG